MKKDHPTTDATLANLGNNEFVSNKNYSGHRRIYSLNIMGDKLLLNFGAKFQR